MGETFTLAQRNANKKIDAALSFVRDISDIGSDKKEFLIKRLENAKKEIATIKFNNNEPLFNQSATTKVNDLVNNIMKEFMSATKHVEYITDDRTYNPINERLFIVSRDQAAEIVRLNTEIKRLNNIIHTNKTLIRKLWDRINISRTTIRNIKINNELELNNLRSQIAELVRRNNGKDAEVDTLTAKLLELMGKHKADLELIKQLNGRIAEIIDMLRKYMKSNNDNTNYFLRDFDMNMNNLMSALKFFIENDNKSDADIVELKRAIGNKRNEIYNIDELKYQQEYKDDGTKPAPNVDGLIKKYNLLSKDNLDLSTRYNKLVDDFNALFAENNELEEKYNTLEHNYTILNDTLQELQNQFEQERKDRAEEKRTLRLKLKILQIN
jgi:chromosome segregation ATPase